MMLTKYVHGLQDRAFFIPIGYILKGLRLPKISIVKTWEFQDFHFLKFQGKAIGCHLHGEI
jgi:hypothetical protein